MAVSGNMRLSGTTLLTGSAGVNAQRGTATWGANYVFSPSGLQHDIGVLADQANSPVVAGNMVPNTSGTLNLGSANNPFGPSGIYMQSDDGNVYRIAVFAPGIGPKALVSGVLDSDAT